MNEMKKVLEMAFVEYDEAEKARPMEKDGSPNVVWQNPVWFRVLSHTYEVRTETGKYSLGFATSVATSQRDFEVDKIVSGGKRRKFIGCISSEREMHH